MQDLAADILERIEAAQPSGNRLVIQTLRNGHPGVFAMIFEAKAINRNGRLVFLMRGPPLDTVQDANDIPPKDSWEVTVAPTHSALKFAVRSVLRHTSYHRVVSVASPACPDDASVPLPKLGAMAMHWSAKYNCIGGGDDGDERALAEAVCALEIQKSDRAW